MQQQQQIWSMAQSQRASITQPRVVSDNFASQPTLSASVVSCDPQKAQEHAEEWFNLRRRSVPVTKSVITHEPVKTRISKHPNRASIAVVTPNVPHTSTNPTLNPTKNVIVPGFPTSSTSKSSISLSATQIPVKICTNEHEMGTPTKTHTHHFEKDPPQIVCAPTTGQAINQMQSTIYTFAKRDNSNEKMFGNTDLLPSNLQPGIRKLPTRQETAQSLYTNLFTFCNVLEP